VIKNFLTILSVIILTSSNAFAEKAKGHYELENEQTRVKFASKMCEPDLLMGEFGNVKGTIYFDEENVENSEVFVEIDAMSATFNKEFHGEDHIDTIVKSAKFLNVDLFPKITFKSTSIRKTSEFTGMLVGEMTLVGKTWPMELEVTFRNKDANVEDDGNRDVVYFSAFGKFKRSDYGILYALERMGIRKIGDEVTVMISATANKKDVK